METFLRVAALIVGVLVLAATAFSLFTALVVPRATSSRCGPAAKAVARPASGNPAAPAPHSMT